MGLERAGTAHEPGIQPADERRFQLPEGVDADKIEASFKKGVLTVTLPKEA